jgi:hypothetical protein
VFACWSNPYQPFSRTTSITVARRLARGAAYGIEEQFDAARKTGVWPIASIVARSAILGPVEGKHQAPSNRSSIGMAELCELYLNDPTMQRSPKSAVVYRTTFKTISEILGQISRYLLCRETHAEMSLRRFKFYPAMRGSDGLSFRSSR